MTMARSYSLFNFNMQYTKHLKNMQYSISLTFFDGITLSPGKFRRLRVFSLPPSSSRSDGAVWWLVARGRNKTMLPASRRHYSTIRARADQPRSIRRMKRTGTPSYLCRPGHILPQTSLGARDRPPIRLYTERKKGQKRKKESNKERKA